MVSAVWHQEWLLGSRRNKLYLFRWIWAAWLIVLLLYGYLHCKMEHLRDTRASMPEIVGQWFAETFVAQQMLLIALAVPAFVAGSVTDEKRRGTLQYLLTTDLESRHIVLGKLLGRVAQVALVSAAGLPLFALLAGFGGVSPATIAAVAIALLVPLFALASATLLASVWCRQTRDAVLAVYVCGTLGGLAVRYGPGFLHYLNPLYAAAPAWGEIEWSELGRRLLIASLGWGALGGVCLALAVARLRPAFRKELENARPRRAGLRKRPENSTRGVHALPLANRAPVQDEPIRWRERHVEGVAPLSGLRGVPQWLGISSIAVLTTLSSLLILWASLPFGVGVGNLLQALLRLQPAQLIPLLPSAGDGFLVQGVVVMLLASLIVGIRCSGAITGERERKTWEALLLTPLSAKQLIRGKLWGILGASYVYLLAYAVPALTLSVCGGVLSLIWVVLWLGLTFLAMYYIGAAGLWCSVRARDSWRALLGTMLAGYVGGLAIYVCSTPFVFMLAAVLSVLLTLLDRAMGTQWARSTTFALFDHRVFFTATCVALVLIFWLMARLFLSRALRWIADRERTRHWYDEPLYHRFANKMG